MAPRILLTGIPSHFTRLIQRAHGSAVIYSERQPRPEGKDAFFTELRNISNTGNYLIGEGALGALSSNATHIPFWHLYNACTTGAGLDEINANFDICVFTCANLLRKGLSADAEALVLEHLNMPVVMLGIGIQKRDDLASSLPQGTRKLLQVIKKKEHYFLTRGRETASFLKDEGFSFVKPVGCPSIYLMPGNVRRALRALPHVRIPQARTVFSGYLGATLTAIDDVNALTSLDSTSSYVIQDELLHFDMQIEPDESGRVYNSASGELIGKTTFKGQDRLQRSLKLYAFYDTNQWRAWTSTMDFSFGRRFHGAIIALQAGVPGLMVAVDDRMREMLDFSGLPYVEATILDHAENRAEFVADHIAGLHVAEILDHYNEREQGFRAALAEIGIAQPLTRAA